MTSITTRTKRPKEYVYKSTLRSEYGLTPSMIDELGEPDEFVENSHYKSGPAASLYRIDRVEAWLAANQERVEKAGESRVRRSAAAKKRHDEKRAKELAERRREAALRREQAEEWVRTVAITCQTPLPPTLIADAKQRYTFRVGRQYWEQPAVHAYVRHHLTNYDVLRNQPPLREWRSECYHLLRNRVDEVVAQAVLAWKTEYHDIAIRIHN
jgi:hypothetical protein